MITFLSLIEAILKMSYQETAFLYPVHVCGWKTAFRLFLNGKRWIRFQNITDWICNTSFLL